MKMKGMSNGLKATLRIMKRIKSVASVKRPAVRIGSDIKNLNAEAKNEKPE